MATKLERNSSKKSVREEIRPIYAELQGLWQGAPTDKREHFTDQNLWTLLNRAVDQLSQITADDYSHFKVTPQRGRERWPWVYVTDYRSKLSGLISRLHAEFFPDEPSPLAVTPGMLISQNQQQNQAVHIQIAVELTEQLTRKEGEFPEGTKERKFIDRAKDYLKSAISGAANMAQLIATLLKIATECGLSVDDVQGIFGG